MSLFKNKNCFKYLVSPKHIKAKDDIHGHKLLNIGCGAQTHDEWNNLDFSPYSYLAKHKYLIKCLRSIKFLSDSRYRNLIKIDPEIIHWNVCKGLPFKDDYFDIVYHSHFITHLDRDIAVKVMNECYRVLKPKGIIRVVVPDLEKIITIYNDAIKAIEANEPSGSSRHADAIDELFELMVRNSPRGTSYQNIIVQLMERIIRGNIEKRGELRRWQYDRFSMADLMNKTGFQKIAVASATASRIDDWNRFALDINADGSDYKMCSLFMEGQKY